MSFVTAAMFGMVGLALMELVLGAFGAQIGLFGVSGLGMVTAVVGLVLGVFMLIMDFDFVEQGVRNQIPEQESWRAAFAMTVSLVWIYTNLLRLLVWSQAQLDERASYPRINDLATAELCGGDDPSPGRAGRSPQPS